MSREQAQRDYLEARARYEEHLNMAVYAFLMTKYPERKVRRNPDLIEQHMDEFKRLLESSNGKVYQWVREAIQAMNEAQSRM